ncbi:MAG: hypothetical protein ACTSWL_01125, partial [Promethearchaeota archaeon]
YNEKGDLIGIDFFISLTNDLKKSIDSDIKKYLAIIRPNQTKLSAQMDQTNPEFKGRKDNTYRPTSFTDLLGTYRIRITHIFIPLLVCILSATFLAWVATYQADIDINVSIFPEQSNAWQIILNGLIPVLISAVFITFIWILIKKFGMVAFKIIMGIIVMFYTWYGFVFFTSIGFEVFWDQMASINATLFNIIYEFLFYGSMLVFIFVLIQFFRNKLNIHQRNFLVLTYGIFMGSIFGVALPMWSIFSFAIFLSIWDLITVFYGPLGQIAKVIKDNQKFENQILQEKIKSGEITPDQAEQFHQFVSLQTKEKKKISWNFLKDIQIELGSGDLILYSALVASVFINTLNWITTIAVIGAVLAGAVLTLYLLLSKRKMLPALPFSMAFGIITYFIIQGIQLLF